MSDAVTGLRKAVVERVLRGDGKTTREARAAAFANEGVVTSAAELVDKIANVAWTITDDDVEAVKRTGLSEDEIFELSVCAALGQSTRQLESVLAAVETAFEAKR